VGPFKGAYRIAAVAAGIHLACVALTAWYVSALSQTSGQAVLLWVYWLLIDFPVSLLGYFLFDGQFFLVHAVIGSLWWFFLVLVIARIVQALRRRFA
jgi:hypothetical protein